VAPDDAARTREATLAYNSGLAALKKNDWNLAAQNFGRAAALSPDDAGALSFLGYVRLQQKRWDDALNALLAAQDTGKNLDARTKAQLLNNIGFARWNKDQFPEAKAAFISALELDKTYFDARYNLAFALLSRDQYTDALPHLRLLAVQNPKDGAIQDGIAESLEKTGNLSGALGAYKKALELEPKNESYRFKFALALVQSDRRADAVNQLKLLLAQNPSNAPVLLQLGDLHLKSNRWGDAAAALKRYVALRGNDFTGRFNLGVAYDYSAKFDEALAQYAEAEKLRSDDAATKNNVGRIYFKRERLDEAVTKFNEALTIDPKFYDARINLAIVLAAQNKWEESSAEWTKLAQSAEAAAKGTTDAEQKKALNARRATAYSGLASNALAQNKFKEAATQYKRLIQLSPGDLEARSGLGRAYYQDKDLAGAEAVYREIIARDPKNASAYNDLGVVLEARKDRKGALDAYMQALELQADHNEAKSNVARLKGNAAIG
jgi:Flp pilus assembly protein TadD